MPILSETPRKVLSTPRLTPHTCCRPTKAIPTILGGESGLLEQLVLALRSSLASAIGDIFVVSLAVTAVAFAVTMFLKELPLRTYERPDVETLRAP